jgi:hypothetical protein
MMRLVLMGLAAFLLSLGGTTGALVMKRRSASAADSTKVSADSAARVDSVGAHAAAPGAHADTGAVHPVAANAHADTSHADSGHGAGAHAAAEPLQPDARLTLPHDSVSRAAAAAPDRVPTDSSLSARPVRVAEPAAAASFRQLARIFSNMKTSDAVKVLAFMSDDEVQGVLEQLGVRQAAGLLAALPKERAAVLSRRLLHADQQQAS